MLSCGMEQQRQLNIRFDAQGRALIPKSVRMALSIENGDEVVGWLDEGRLVLEPRQALLARLQARYGDIDGSLADELIEERRDEARRESP